MITGGEPLLQRHALRPLASKPCAQAATASRSRPTGRSPPGELAGLVDQWNVSPKLPHAGNEGLATIRPHALAALIAEANTWFKFVVIHPRISSVSVCSPKPGIARDRVILMPQGRTRAELEDRSAWLAEACAAAGYRFSSRLHILLWGDKRGI